MVIEERNGVETLVYKNHHKILAPSFLRDFILIHEDFEKENLKTREYFYKRFGQRLARIEGFNPKSKEALFASEIQNIFFEMALVRKSDLEGRADCKKYESLVPEEFKRADHLNLKLNSLKGELAHRIWELYTKEKPQQIEWSYLKAHIGIPDLPVGLIFPEKEGFRHIKERIKFNGGYAYLYEGGAKLQLHFMGTIPNLLVEGAWRTFYNDLLPEIGSDGIERFLESESAKKIFSNPKKREFLEVIGYSLGGAYAQRLAMRHPEAISHLITVCSPRIGALGKQGKTAPPKRLQYPVTHIVHVGDPVPAFGEKHLRSKREVQTQLYVILSPNGHKALANLLPNVDEKSFFPLFKAFIDGARPHVTYLNFRAHVVHNGLSDLWESFNKIHQLERLRSNFA